MGNYDLLLTAGNTQKKFTNSSNKRATPTNAATSYRSILQESIANVVRPPVRSMNNASSTNSQVLRGDANNDGVVDKNDLDLLQQHVTELRSVKNFKAADMDGNGKITITDVCQLSLMLQEQEKSAKGIKGDANDDGVVDKKDRELIVQRMFDDMDGVRSSVKVNMDNIDFSGDGKITLEDYAEFLRIYNEQQSKSKQVLKGDANGDGKVNQRDLDLISSRTVNVHTNEKFDMVAADMNGDGEIDNIDVARVNQLVKEHEAGIKTLQGDSNGDGKVDETDYQNLKNYLDGRESSEDFIRKNSDINGDGEIDKKDLQGVRNILDSRKIDWDESKRLIGDVNGDGKIDVVNDAVTVLNYINGYIQRKDFYWDNADVNHDGKIDIEDADRITKFVNGEIPSLDYEPPTEPSILGDVNGDGVVDVINDAVLLNMYIDGEDIGNQTIHLNVADVNGDGVINKDDVQGIDNIFHGRSIDWKPDPVPPPNPIIYPQEREITGYAIWTYTDENLTIHHGNDVVTVGQKVTVLGETENVVHIQYTNVKGELLDRYIPAKPPAYQAWTAQALTYKEALHDDGKQYDKEAVFENEVVTVLNEAENHYLVEYQTKNGSKIRWITKADVIPYEEPTISLKPEHISNKGIELIKYFEAGGHIQDYLKAYLLPGENEYTIGYGHKSADIKKGMTITLAQAEEYLRQDLIDAENYVKKYCAHLNLNQNQFDALVSFTFNCGSKNLQKLLHGESGKENRPLEELPDHMPYYNHDSTGKVLKGLTTRRAAEVALFNTPVDYVVTPTPTPNPNPVLEVDPPFTQGRAIRKTQAWSNIELNIPYSDKYEGLDANEKITVKKAASDDSAYLVEYNSIYGGTKTRWVSAADIEEYRVPDVPQKLQELIDYWTKKGKWENSYSRSKSAEKYLDSTATYCKEFASYIFNILYDTGYVGYGSTRDYEDNWRLKGIPNTIYQVAEVAENRNAAETKEAFRNMFQQAQPGDFIQIKRGHDGAHSAIFVGWTEDGKIKWLDANADGKNGIKLQTYSLDELVATHTSNDKDIKKKYPNGFQWNVAMSIYRAK